MSEKNGWVKLKDAKEILAVANKHKEEILIFIRTGYTKLVWVETYPDGSYYFDNYERGTYEENEIVCLMPIPEIPDNLKW